MILTSRPHNYIPSDISLAEAVKPAVELVKWVTGLIQFRDNFPSTVREAQGTLEEMLSCLEYEDCTIVPLPSVSSELRYEIAVKPFPGNAYVAFGARFRVQP